MEFANVEQLTKKPLPWKDTLIIPIGDIQLQSKRENVDMDRLKKVIDFGVEHDAFYVGMGDFIDMESPSNRAFLRGATLYDSAVDALDASAEELEDELKEVFKPTIGRWLGLLEGHHFHHHQDGTTTDVRFAQYLKAPFLGTCGYIGLTFKSPGKHVNNQISIWAHHGRGGGKLMSSSLNQLESAVRGFDADIYLIGHHHKSNAAKPARIYPSFGTKHSTLRQRELILATTGSFLKGYLEGSQQGGRAGGLYPERGMMNPLALGSVKIWLRPRFRSNKLWGNSGTPVVEMSVEI
jgi:hypothetical protein